MLHFIPFLVFISGPHPSSAKRHGSGSEESRICGRSHDDCPAGCWHESGLMYADGSRMCVPTGPGYYSPYSDNFRYACTAGTYSNVTAASTCTMCPIGTYSAGFGATTCSACSSGTYSDTIGTASCSSCDPIFHDSEGANSAFVSAGTRYCMRRTKTPTMTPTVTPAPTQFSSDQPSTAPSMSRQPSYQPSVEVSLSNETDFLRDEDLKTVIETDTCGEGTFFLHGACATCPKRFKAIFVPLSMVCFLLGLVIYLLNVAPCCTAILFIGMEHLQILVLLGTVHVPWTRTIDNFYWILSVFVLDLEAAVPLQCHVGLPPQANHMLVLILPILFYLVPLVFFQVHHARGKISRVIVKLRMRRVKNWLAIGLFFGTAKLLLTSFEAISCSSLQDRGHEENPIDWFCVSSGDIWGALGSVCGIAGFFAYGVACPWWVIHNLSITQEEDLIHDFPVVRGGRHAPRDMNHWTRLFLRPFERASWWWTGFLLGRKCVLVTLIFLLQDAPFLTLTLIMILLVLSEIIQENKRPYAHDNEVNHQDDEPIDEEVEHHDGNPDEVMMAQQPTRRHLWKLSTVGLVLHCCLVFGIMLALIFLAISDEAKAARVALTTMFLIVMVPSLIYLVVAACSCIRRDCRHSFPLYEERDSQHQAPWNKPRCEGDDETPKKGPDIFRIAAGSVTLAESDTTKNGDEASLAESLTPHGSTATEERDLMAATSCEYDGTGSSLSKNHEERKTNGGSFGYDDTMEGWQQPLATFDKSWVPMNNQCKAFTMHHTQDGKQLEAAHRDPAVHAPSSINQTLMEQICASEDEIGNNYIFVDDESAQSSSMVRHVLLDESTDPSSNWIDNLGFPTTVHNKSSQPQTDMQLLSPTTSLSTPTTCTANSTPSSSTNTNQKMTSLSDEEEEELEEGSTRLLYLRNSSHCLPPPRINTTNNDNNHKGTVTTICRIDSATLGRIMVLQPFHRVEPSTWGQRQSGVYQPQVKERKPPK
jgi:hypothetical protein